MYGDDMRLRRPTSPRREPDPEDDAIARVVIGAAIEVHRHLGPGYLEKVYEDSLAIEMNLRDIPFERQSPIAIDFKGHPVGSGFLDFLACDRVIVELKAVDEIAPIHRAQVLSYLRATKLTLGLIINFNVKTLADGVKRVIQS